MITIDIDALADAISERLATTNPNASPWMRIDEAAEYMCCSDRWIRDRLGEIPHSRVDGKLLFDRRELDSWLTNHRRR